MWCSPTAISYLKTLLLKGGFLSRYALICQGLHHAHTTAKKSEHLHGSLAPRTYSIICISSESCLGSIVGFAQHLCFGTLRSAISAKVAPGELLWLCPGSAGLSTSVEKAKTDCHDKVRDWSLFGEVFRVPKDLCRLGRGASPVRLTGMYRAPNSGFRIPGASPKIEIIEFYG